MEADVRRCGVRRDVALLCVALALLAHPASAQLVRGSVQAEDGTPVATALVLAMDAGGETRATRITDSDGSFTLALPGAGEWTLRVERLGYGTGERMVTVAADETVELVLTVAPDPVAVRGIDVVVGRRCPERAGGPEVVKVWSEARAVLADADRSDPADRARFRIVTTERDYTYHQYRERFRPPRSEWTGGRLRWDADTVWAEGGVAMTAEAPEVPLGEGFIRPAFPGLELDDVYLYQYSAPGPSIILSDAFLSTHCFFLREQPGKEAWIGLGFEPDRLSGLEHDVEGTFWLPASDHVLPHIEFRYTRHPRQDELRVLYEIGGRIKNRDRQQVSNLDYVPADSHDRFEDLGGRIDLSHVPDVGWIVHRFRLTWPLVIRQTKRVVQPAYRTELRAGDWRTAYEHSYLKNLLILWYIREFTAEVIEVEVPGG